MTTALKPYDFEAAQIREVGLQLAEQAEALVISDDQDDAIAKTVLAHISKGLKAAEARRVELKAPALAECNAIDSAFGEATAPFKTAKKLIDKKTGDYCAAKEACKEAALREQERREREEMAERAKAEAEAAAKGEELAPAPKTAVAVPETPAVVRTEAGNVGMVKHRGYKIVDESKIPDEYWVLDRARIAAEYKAGGDVPGCEEEITYRPRTR